MNYYNEYEPFASKWLKQLIVDGLIPPGDVDDRSIADVKSSDLSGYTQCHFFAGIGGWSRALEIAQWDSDRPVWTGSPPCQSFSVAGKGKGKDDERHLWPVFFNLIRECQPPTVFGEQVAAAIKFGWLDDLQNDFEKEGYASGACVLPSGAVGSPHKRDRLFFTAKRVGNASGSTSERQLGAVSGAQEKVGGEGTQHGDFSIGHSNASQVDRCKFVADTSEKRWKRVSRGREEGVTEYSEVNSMAHPEDAGSQRGLQGRSDSQREVIGGHVRRSCSVNSMADSSSDGFSKGSDSESSKRPEDRQEGSEVRSFASNGCDIDSVGNTNSDRSTQRNETSETTGHRNTSDTASIWAEPRIIYCRDGKYRPIPTEPEVFPLADGISNRVGILRGAGNAIVPQAAAEIIKAVM